MLVDVRDSFGAEITDIYPFVDDELRAPFSARISVFDGEIRYQGNVWTSLEIQQFKDAMNTALAVVESEQAGPIMLRGETRE